MHKKKTLIYVCSPYSGQEENYHKAQTYGAYVFAKGGIPVIPHTMYHGILKDKNPADREKALTAGRELLKLCDRVWVFGKQGCESSGMKGEIREAAEIGIPVEYIDGSKPLQPDEKAASISACLRHYEQTYGTITRIMVEDIKEYIDCGISDKLICLAIDVASRHNAQWPYARAILNRCKAQGITTVEDFEKASGKTDKPKNDFAAYDFEEFERRINERED